MNYIYTKKDFTNLGVAEGSFNDLIKKLNLNNANYRIKQQNSHGRMIYYFTEEAYNKVAKYLKNKEDSKNSTELMLLNANNELKMQVQDLQNKLSIATAYTTQQENEYLKKIDEIKEKNINEQLKEQRKYEDLKDKYNILEKEKNAEIERLKHRNLIKRILNLS